MLEKRIELKTSDLIVLLSWLKAEQVQKNKKFSYDTLLNRCMYDSTGNVEVDGYFDDLMLDLYIIYEKLSKVNPEDLENKIVESPLFNVLPKDWIKESMRSLESFFKLFEELMMTSKFEYPQIRGIQKNMMNDFLTKYITNEEFEKCIQLKENIKEI